MECCDARPPKGAAWLFYSLLVEGLKGLLDWCISMRGASELPATVLLSRGSSKGCPIKLFCRGDRPP